MKNDTVIRIPKETGDFLIATLRDYFLPERGEEISNLTADLMPDFIGKEIGPACYNLGVADSYQ